MSAVDRAPVSSAAVDLCPSDPGPILTPDALAERWSVPKSHVWRLAREGRLPSVRLGRYVRFRLAEVEAFEAAGGTS
jgi:excisionase family DNA binding protein